MHTSCGDGLWRRNPLLVRLLGFCPLLAVSDRLVTAAAIGLVMVLALLWTELLTSAARSLLPAVIHPVCQAIFAAAGVTVLDLLMQAHLPSLSQALGIYVPVVAGCCFIIAHADEFAARRSVAQTLADGACHGLGILAVLIPLAALRELAGYGSLLRDAHLLWPAAGNWPGVVVLPEGLSLAVVVEPAGALLVLGAVFALSNRLAGSSRAQRPMAHEQREAQRDLRAF